MEIILTLFAITGAAIWLTILLLPWRPWSTNEVLDVSSPLPEVDLGDITVLIPARNEAETIKATLPALTAQGRGLNIILIDDQSSDGTGQVARKAVDENLLIIKGKSLPSGWTGKLWALEQGRSHIRTSFTLLLDADIEPLPGIIGELKRAMQERDVQLISLMAELRMDTFWEKLLMPAFIYFFKLLYPFRLSNTGTSRVAAAAGGCILLETRLLHEIGGFDSLRGELIDDCALARRIKTLGYKTWIGLTHSVRSIRPYEKLRTIWEMVARTAFTQLNYSGLLLALCTAIMVLSFVVPGLGLFLPSGMAKFFSALGLAIMILCYLPTLKFYGLPGRWALALPLIGILYLAMTWTSAMRYWLGGGSHWKGRAYSRF
ncbi:MAG: glycosyltransferase [Deltaproteobacteria bacterium]|nr:glycosyltransferase [Deltaproteobacteria bacterium]PNV82703.1 MAG: glycosyl transferase [Desulfobacteraceae bacterium]MDH3773291.1 glycosyltransferase [Deltaproteobacteria bacterium]MDH3801257.1 glycosyltransferase [Deltaproteobacteria bacterium]MDH3850960.1 glycosyltransferase [Deltaproteobacteria bacterium]